MLRRLEVALRLELPVRHSSDDLLLERVLPCTVVSIEILYVLLILRASHYASPLLRRHACFFLLLRLKLYIVTLEVGVVFSAVKLVGLGQDRVADVSHALLLRVRLVNEDCRLFNVGCCIGF